MPELLIQQVESRTNVHRFGLMQEGERAKEKEPIMNRILKNVAALALIVGGAPLEAWESAMLNTTATTTILMGRDRHTTAPIVLTALWRPRLLAAAITQTR